MTAVRRSQREPGKDSLVGVAISHLLKWLADPGNRLARGVVEMSPFHARLRQQHGEDWNAIWNGLTRTIASHGYRACISELAESCGVDWLPYNRRRLEDILQTLGELERPAGGVGEEAAEQQGQPDDDGQPDDNSSLQLHQG